MISRGFTLLELMVVLVIVFIMAAIALPNLSGLTQRKNLEQQGNEIISLFYRAREMAMEQESTWRIVFSPEQAMCICFGDANGNSSIDQGEPSLGPYVLPKGIIFGSNASKGPNNTNLPDDGVSFVKNRVSFSNMGTCNSGTIYLSSPDRSLAIRLLPASGSVLKWEYIDSWRDLP